MAPFAPLPAWLDAHSSADTAPPAGADLSTPARQSTKYGAARHDPVDAAPSLAGHPRAARKPKPLPTPGEATRSFEFRHRARFWWKTGLLAATTLALIPILLYESAIGAQWYLWFLLTVHVFGLGVFAWGVSRHDIAPSTWGFAARVAALVIVVALLFLASKGLQSTVGTAVFWGSLFAIWALHTGGLALLHLRGARETRCPFA
jgi:hypothetical protein